MTSAVVGFSGNNLLELLLDEQQSLQSFLCAVSLPDAISEYSSASCVFICSPSCVQVRRTRSNVLISDLWRIMLAAPFQLSVFIKGTLPPTTLKTCSQTSSNNHDWFYTKHTGNGFILYFITYTASILVPTP